MFKSFYINHAVVVYFFEKRPTLLEICQLGLIVQQY